MGLPRRRAEIAACAVDDAEWRPARLAFPCSCCGPPCLLISSRLISRALHRPGSCPPRSQIAPHRCNQNPLCPNPAAILPASKHCGHVKRAQSPPCLHSEALVCPPRAIGCRVACSHASRGLNEPHQSVILGASMHLWPRPDLIIAPLLFSSPRLNPPSSQHLKRHQQYHHHVSLYSSGCNLEVFICLILSSHLVYL